MADRSRKAPKRKPARVEIEPDLAELAAAIDAQRLERTAEGWFSEPWRYGWYAAELALDAFWQTPDGAAAAVSMGSIAAARQIALSLKPIVEGRREDAHTYWLAGDLLDRPSIYPTDSESQFFDGYGAVFVRAALRCIQTVIANSDAGGAAYNSILRIAFDRTLPDPYEGVVELHRMHDALHGKPTTPVRENAFRIAWRRGLYKAAYAV